MSNEKNTDRRKFLKSSITFATGSYLITVIGCGDEDDDLDDDDNSILTPKVGDKDENNENENGDPSAPEVISVEMSADLKKVGGFQIVTDNAILKKLDANQKILLVRADENTVYANTTNCTHQGTEVQFNEDQNLLICPAHGSRFRLTGEVVQGPAQKPLTHFKATIENDLIILEKI